MVFVRGRGRGGVNGVFKPRGRGGLTKPPPLLGPPQMHHLRPRPGPGLHLPPGLRPPPGMRSPRLLPPPPPLGLRRPPLPPFASPPHIPRRSFHPDLPRLPPPPMLSGRPPLGPGFMSIPSPLGRGGLFRREGPTRGGPPRGGLPRGGPPRGGGLARGGLPKRGAFAQRGARGKPNVKKNLNTLNIEEQEINKPWISEAIKNEIMKKHKLYQKAKKSNEETDWNEFKEQKNKVVTMVSSSKLEYIGNHPEEALHNARDFTPESAKRSAEVGIPIITTWGGALSELVPRLLSTLGS
uniref:Uncharacterized protein n=1 Tax=Timema cristinae TaxID=61476 RepID=A0A7R9H5A9_TIMCR|nr:unnamed protein product [Timema cristinae]